GRLLWIEHDVHRCREFGQMETYRLAHTTLDAVTNNGSAERPRNRDSDAWSGQFRRSPGKIKSGQQPGKVPLPILVYVLKIGMFQQLGRFGEPERSTRREAYGRLRILGSGVHLSGYLADKNVRPTLLAEAGLHGDAFASLGATARQNRRSALCFHTATEPVRLRAATTVGLKRALGHGKLTAPI